MQLADHNADQSFPIELCLLQNDFTIFPHSPCVGCQPYLLINALCLFISQLQHFLVLGMIGISHGFFID